MVSIGGGLKAAVVAADVVAGRVFREGKVPEKPTFPYVTFNEEFSNTPSLEGDCDVLARVQLGQVDLWQKSKDEDFTLARKLRNGLTGFAVVADQKIWKCKVVDSQRLDDPDPELVHHALTIRMDCEP